MDQSTYPLFVPPAKIAKRPAHRPTLGESALARRTVSTKLEESTHRTVQQLMEVMDRKEGYVIRFLVKKGIEAVEREAVA